MKASAYDLEERTAQFGEAVIEFCLELPSQPVTSPLIAQLVGAATTIGANYREADEAESKKDFRHKVAICRKEAKETKYWLRMMAKAAPTRAATARTLWTEGRSCISSFALSSAPPIRTFAKNAPRTKPRGPSVGDPWSLVTGPWSL